MKKKRHEKQSIISIEKDEVLLLKNLLSQNNKTPDHPSLFTRKKEERFKQAFEYIRICMRENKNFITICLHV